jgi:hypothetical protein
MRRVGVLSVGLVVVMLGLGSTVLQSCGKGNEKRTRERCEICDGRINEGCRQECLDLCLPTDADCEARCTRECDQCKKELSCQACASSCTGSELRCAPTDEVITCEDGNFGEGPQASPQPTTTLPRTATPVASPTVSASP